MVFARLSERLKKRRHSFRRYKILFEKKYGRVLEKLPPAGRRGLVSVVLPVFNGEKYLDEAIASVLQQTYDSIELIIVNDGSVDATEEIILKFKNPQIKYIRHNENKGLPAALNTGFAAAGGEYYTWISHDNIMLPDFIRTAAEELEANKAAAMVYGNMRLIDESGGILRGKGWFEHPPLSGSVILPQSVMQLNDVANNTIGAAFLYRANAAALLGGYDVRRFGIEDYDYWMRMNEVFDIVHMQCGEPLYLYRFHSGSLTAGDERLGITRRRPELMDYDRLRRRRLISDKNDGSVRALKAVLNSLI